MDLINNLLESHLGLSFALGVASFSFFAVWRKLSLRWINWFPLVSKVARMCLYACAFVLAYVALKVVSSEALSPLSGLAFLAGMALVPALGVVTAGLRKKETVLRGTRVADASTVNRLTAKLPRSEFQESFEVAGVRVPRGAEPYHLLVVGSTGSGKSVALTQLLDHIQARGDVALIVDSGGEYASRYYNPQRDYIINPFDDRCVPWSPTAELEGPWDAEALAKSMIPDGVGDSKEWNGYAQTLVTSVLRKLIELQRLSIKDLLYYCQAAPLEELSEFLAGTPAAAQLVSDRTFGSIRTIATSYLATYAYLSDNSNPFSVAKFIRREAPGFAFLTYRDDQLDSLRNMISCVLDVAARTILAMPANSQRRVWLVIDEFASIGKVQSIEAVATKARKVGGCLVLGLQAVSQLRDRYGEHGAQTILSCLSSWLVLRCSDADTAEYISKYIGETELSRLNKGESSSDTGGSDSLNEQILTQRAVLPVELQRLANLSGFFKLAGDYPIAKVTLKFPQKRERAAENYALRDFNAKPMLSLTKADQGGAVLSAPEVPAVLAESNGEAEGAGGGRGGSGALDFRNLEVPPGLALEIPEDAGATKIISSTTKKRQADPEALEDVLNQLAVEESTSESSF